MSVDSVDRSFEACIALDNSWTLNARLANVCPEGQITPALLSRLFLVTYRDQVQIALKPKRDWFEPFVKLFTGESEDENFHRQIQKVNLYFNTIKKTLTAEEKGKLLSLEEKLNALGRYVFSGRTGKTILCIAAPTLRNYQLRYSVPEVLIQPGVIKRSLSNSTWKLCWLNSSLKYMAASSTYDRLLAAPQLDPQLERLRQALFRMIEALRKNWDQHIIDGLQEELIEEIDNGPFKLFLAGQQDAADFLLQLQNHFTDPSREPIRIMKLYKSFADTYIKGGATLETQRLDIVPQGEGEEIDIPACYSAEGVIDDVKEYFTTDQEQLVPANDKSDKLSFRHQDVIVQLPEVFEVTLRRGNNYNRQQLVGYVSNKRIKLQPGGYITFTEHEPVFQEFGKQKLLVDCKPKGEKRYKIIAAIEQRGSTNQRGHYVAYTRDIEGITSHNDRSVSHNQTEEAFKAAYHLMLKREPASERESS